MPRLPEGRSSGLALVYKQSACSFGPALLSLEWLDIQGFLKHKREKSTFWPRVSSRLILCKSQDHRLLARLEVVGCAHPGCIATLYCAHFPF
jgi:hypothetical protein